MNAKPSLYDTDGPAEAEADARAEADIAAGRLISHAAVVAWLKSWGSDKPLDRPQVGD